jgi:hypothetical protein
VENQNVSGANTSGKPVTTVRKQILVENQNVSGANTSGKPVTTVRKQIPVENQNVSGANTSGKPVTTVRKQIPVENQMSKKLGNWPHLPLPQMPLPHPVKIRRGLPKSRDIFTCSLFKF